MLKSILLRPHGRLYNLFFYFCKIVNTLLPYLAPVYFVSCACSKASLKPPASLGRPGKITYLVYQRRVKGSLKSVHVRCYKVGK